MAKKVVVAEAGNDGENTKKKKKKGLNKCCTCCLVILIIFVVIAAAGFGVGWYFGDQFTKEYLDMSLGDCFGVLGDMYWANDKKVVTRPYSDSDLDGFYKEIKRNIMLKDDANVDFDGALRSAVESVLDNMNGSQSNYNASAKQTAAYDHEYYNEHDYDDYDYDYDNDHNGGSDGGLDGQIMAILTGMITNVFSYENVDRERINAYDENDPSTDAYKFDLNDKQLAAFINAALKIVFENADKIDELKEFAKMVEFADVLALKQIEFSTVQNGESLKAVTAKLTVWVGLQSAAGQAATYYIQQGGFGWLGPLARGMCNMILPKNLYLTLSIPISGDAEPFININDMDDKSRARAYKLINRLASGGEQDIINETLIGLTEALDPTLEAAAEYLDFKNAHEGTITFDFLDTVIKIVSDMFIEEGDEPLTKSDFIYVLQALMSDPDVQLAELEPYMFRDRYLVNGKEVYIKGGDPSKEAINYENKFIEEIEDKYSLDFGDSKSLTEVLAMLGVSLDGSNNGEAGSQDLLGLIDSQKFNASLNRNIDELKLVVTDRMLGAAMSGQMNKVLGDELSGMNLKLDALSFVKKPNKPNNLYAQLAVEADTSGLIGSLSDDGLFTQLAAGLMPSKLLFTVTVDITQNLPAGMQKDKMSFMLNSCQNTDRALDTIEKLMPSFSIGEMSKQIDVMFNDMLDQMYKMMNIKLVASTYEKTDGVWSGDPGAIEMPDIFTFVTDMVLVDDDGNRVVSPDRLKAVLQGINDTSGVQLGGGIANDYSGFIADVVDKYYLAPAQGDKMETLDDLTSFMSAFDTGKFRMSGTDPDVKYMAYDTRTVSQLKPTMTAPQLGALIKQQMGEAVADYTVECVATGMDKLTVTLSIAVGDLLPEDVGFLLTANKLYVTAAINMSIVDGSGSSDDPYRYYVGVTVNSMDSAVYSSLLDIVRFFQPSFDITAQVNEFGEILYTQMSKINNSFASEGGSNGGNNFFAFTNEGLVMTDFYTFLANKMGVVFSDDTDESDIKAALQGMYPVSTVPELYNENNYVQSSIVYNQGSDTWDGGIAPIGNNSDKAFNGYLAKNVSDRVGAVNIVQTVALASANNTKAATDSRAWLNARLGTPLDPSLDYIAVTVGMNMNDYMQSDDKSDGFFPVTTVYGTLVYKFENGTFTNIGTIFNDMGAGRFNVLQQIMKLSPDSDDESKINIKSIGSATETVLNGVANVRNVIFGGMINNEGIGSINTTEKQNNEV